MSSRNRFLPPEDRAQAHLIYEGLTATKSAWIEGERSSEALRAIFSAIVSRSPKMIIQYSEIVDCFSLLPAAEKVGNVSLVMIVAVLFGDVRLIDNLEF